MRERGEELQPSGCIAFVLCVCVWECLSADGEGAPALLITERLYVNPKASVVVNLGEEAILNVFIVQRAALQMKYDDDVDYSW